MNDAAPISILIADDHPLFLKGLREIIEQESEWRVCGSAQDGQDALDQIVDTSPDIAILDINMPRLDGLAVARYIHERHLSTAIIILTMYDDELLISRAVSCGVKGFIIKESAIDDIIAGVETVARGGYFLSPRLSGRLFHGSSEHHILQNVVRMELTKMERKVIRLVSEDLTTRDIAEKLFISPKTVENHRSNICKKLKLHGKNALLRYVLEHKETLQRILQEC
ncbi:response regulator transcription factor [bacterium]|nr:response regulator transcription factor [bacterium]